MALDQQLTRAQALGASQAEMRRKLNAYMEDQGIGLAALRERIAANASQPPADLNDKILLRFLAGREPAGDDILALCAAFIEQAGQPEPVIMFGEALCGFQQCVDDEARLAPVCGAYKVTAHLPPIEGFRIKDPQTDYGRIELEAVPGRPFLRAIEHTPDRPRIAEEDAPGHEFEGAAIMQAHGLTVVLRDVLTRRPKTYVLDRQAEGKPGEFSGVVSSPAYDGRSGAGGVVLDVSLARIEKG